MPPPDQRLEQSRISEITGKANSHWNDFVDMKSTDPVSVISSISSRTGVKYGTPLYIDDASLVDRKDVSLVVLTEYLQYLAGQVAEKLGESDVPKVAIQADDLSRFKPNLRSPDSELAASWLLWKFPPDARSEIVILYDESLFNGDTLTRNKLCLHEMGHMVLHRALLLRNATMTKGRNVYVEASLFHEMEAWWFSYSTLASCAANIAYDARKNGSLSDTVHDRRFL